MAITFTANPNVNDVFSVGGRTWTWSGSEWILQATTAGAASINTNELVDSAVTTAKIAANAVTVAKLPSGSSTGQALLANTSAASGLSWGAAGEPVDSDQTVLSGRTFG
jgi:thiamine biosynthesis protein ThiC